MILTFFDVDGIIYTKYAPIGIKINANYIVEVLAAFMKAMKVKRADVLATKS